MNLNDETIQILNGEAPPPNEVAAFIVPRAQAARNEGQQLLERAAQLKGEMAQIQTRIAELQGVTKQYVEDVKACLIKQKAEKEQEEFLEEEPPTLSAIG